MRNEPWVWPEVEGAGTSGAGAVPLRSAQLMGQQKKKKKKTPPGQLRSCVKVEVAVLGSPSLIITVVSVDVKQH